jgi:hypothetical protein
MVFTIGELLEISGNINKLSLIKDIPAVTGYKIATLIRKLRDPLIDADNARSELIKKYAGPPNEKNEVTVLPENMGLYMNELNDLSIEEISIDIKEVRLPADAKLPDATTLVGLDRFITV